MKLLQTTAFVGLAALLLGHMVTAASADHRWRFFQPHYSDREYSVEDDRWYTEDDSDIVDESETYYQERKRRLKKKRNVVVYQDNDEVWYEDDEPPIAKPKKKAAKKPIVKQKPLLVAKKAIEEKSKKQLVWAEKPVVVKGPAKKPLVKKQLELAKLSPKSSLPLDVETLSKPLPKAIGCSNGIEIIAGYGFSAVKPKACSGATYTFDARRANKTYLISLSSKTGEITDVKKIN